MPLRFLLFVCLLYVASAQHRVALPQPVWPTQMALAQRSTSAMAKAAAPASITSSTQQAQQQQARQWLRGMTLKQKAAQVIMVSSFGEAPGVRTKAYREFVSLINNLQVGGIIVVNRVVNGTVRQAEPYAMAAFLNRMQRQARIPLLVGGDFERGASMRVANTVRFPHLMAFAAANDLALTRYLGAYTAREARALGVHWVFAPDADVNNNPDNPIINIRSFGENPQRVSQHVVAFIEGAHSQPQHRVLTTAKHFPGHGDVSTDSHMAMPKVTADRARLEALELVPFRAAIQAGVDSVMTAHLDVPALEPEGLPATVSARVLTDTLRRDLRFRGLIVTDAMDMQGLTDQFSPGESAVRALQAGVDVLLMPPKPEEALRGIVAAVQEGRLSQARLDDAVTKVLSAKAKLGLAQKRLVDVETISDTLDDVEAQSKAQEVADKAITLLRQTATVLPLAQPESACVFVLNDNRYSMQGRKLLEEMVRVKARGRVLDSAMPWAEFDAATAEAAQCSSIVVAPFVSASGFRGGAGLSEPHTQFVQRLLQGSTPVIMISFGNPYLLRSFPTVPVYLTTFSTTQPSEMAAAKVLLGQISPQGRTPVSIPGLADLGSGLSVRR